MKEIHGSIISWDKSLGRGEIQGYDGNIYSFTKKEWNDDNQPEINGRVLVICQNGRDASKVEYLPMEPHSKLEMILHSENGELLSHTKTRFVGGPRRMLSDSIAWMIAAKELHTATSKHQLKNISSLLLKENPLIGLRCSVIKYCYGFSIELYLKWILVEANIKFRPDSKHKLNPLKNKLPVPVLENLRSIYSDFFKKNQPEFKMLKLDVNSQNELNFDWSTFDKYIENLDGQKFIIGRYATPDIYTIFSSSSTVLSAEMNSFMDSNSFFDLADKILSYKPDLKDYPQTKN